MTESLPPSSPQITLAFPPTGEAVSLPFSADAVYVFSFAMEDASFDRSSNDLTITSTAGSRIVLEDFFIPHQVEHGYFLLSDGWAVGFQDTRQACSFTDDDMILGPNTYMGAIEGSVSKPDGKQNGDSHDNDVLQLASTLQVDDSTSVFLPSAASAAIEHHAMLSKATCCSWGQRDDLTVDPALMRLYVDVE